MMVGNVDNFQLGGQEFWIDDVCVSDDPNATPAITAFCNTDCDYGVDFGSVMSVTEWGSVASGPSGFLALPGDLIHQEDGIDWIIQDLPSSDFGGPFFDRIRVTNMPPEPFGTGNVLNTMSSSIEFDLSHLVTDTVCIEFMDLGSTDFIEINGVALEADIAVLADMLATWRLPSAPRRRPLMASSRCCRRPSAASTCRSRAAGSREPTAVLAERRDTRAALS